MQQLPLNLRLRDHATFENFCEGASASAIVALKTGLSPLFLWGQKGTGRTHLLQAVCHQFEHAVYLPLQEQLKPEVLDGLEAVDMICLDDIEAIVGKRDWEEALFHLYNRTQKLIFTANTIPDNLGLTLPDLTSRLNACVRFQIMLLNDDEKLKVLQQRAVAKGLELSQEVGNYLLNHHTRDLSVLLALLDQLDRESLITQRRLTIPFVKTLTMRN